jgi:hypothetical protein
MNDLSFTIGTAGEASRRGGHLDADAPPSSIIEPVTFKLDIGIEHSSGRETAGNARTCVIGVNPAIILQLTPSHVTKVLAVAATWASNL